MRPVLKQFPGEYIKHLYPRLWSRSKNSQSCIIRCKNSRLRLEFLHLIIQSCSFFKQYFKEIFKILPFEVNNRSWLTTLSRAAIRLMYTVYKAYRWSQHTSSKPNSIALHVMSNNLSFNWFWLKLNKYVNKQITLPKILYPKRIWRDLRFDMQFFCVFLKK